MSSQVTQVKYRCVACLFSSSVSSNFFPIRRRAMTFQTRRGANGLCVEKDLVHADASSQVPQRQFQAPLRGLLHGAAPLNVPNGVDQTRVLRVHGPDCSATVQLRHGMRVCVCVCTTFDVVN